MYLFRQFLNIVFVDGFKGVHYLYRFAKTANVDSDIQDMIDEFTLKYQSDGINVLCNLIRGVMTVVFIANLIFNNPSSKIYYKMILM